LEAGVIVYPINPKTASRLREALRPSGATDDAFDARAMAANLRAYGMDWKPLQPEDPKLQELRQLCRDEVELIAERTALVNRLQSALREYYPAALEAFEDWVAPSSWGFVIAYPTPQALHSAGQRKWEKFLHAHKLYRPELQQKRLDIFARALDFCGTKPTTAAKSRLAVACAKMLQTLQLQLNDYRTRIEELFEQHPDSGMFGSLPNCGKKLAPRLLAEIGADRVRFEDAEALQSYAGSAPVTQKSGKQICVFFRRACNKLLRHTVHLWADLSRHACPWAQTYYEAHRAKGHGHADAVRRLAHRWLKILWKMWQTGAPYDADFHAQNQTRHGSWVLTFTPSLVSPKPHPKMEP
jgi:transposase